VDERKFVLRYKKECYKGNFYWNGGVKTDLRTFACHSCPEQESQTQPGKTKNEMPVQVGHDRAYMISFREEPTPNPSLW